MTMSFVRLETWGELNYPDDPPPLTTLRRWARNGNIYPTPILHGRTYRVDPDAFYIKPNKVGLVLEQHHPNGRTGKPSALLEKLISESKKVRC
ncbi:TPA: excisionase [Salmonella enterica subsp. enterica serovar Enteritidis]|uniref:Excisionase n=1 Tax=Salmonella enterica TaxID=28901 RepID=A0A633FQJ4_SALER|nr:excisionase [Salmonella enterica]EAA6271784.1 excisionase [Salmonella enterica subsp. enterica serovar Oslo]EDP9848431.1 excisionase [Salmonella enterica subsp. enterica serovar Arechavaleta]EEN7729260.1 excisionase [Salmonella enterica subsp. enterica serovar Newport]EAA3585169.1 excisionase [Salmonella enterica subsp. enterica serovar Enteritidis]EAC0269643.1 excisionase [Salmonella enterica subsp. enterica serovar Enteritidis]